MTVLVVDDDASARAMLKVVIEDSGADVIGEAQNGEEAIEASQRLHPDLLLLDISMPLMGGFPVARFLLDRMPKLRIIFVSQHREHAYLEEALRCGAKGYVVKSAAVKELPRAMAAAEAGEIYQSALIR